MGKDLAVWNAPKAVDVRREVLPMVKSRLSQSDLQIFEASTKALIGEMEVGELTKKCAVLFRGLAMDVGCPIPEGDMWAYQQTRLLDLLRRYYGQLSLAEVKVAFEMAMMGELGEYLPKDANGAPDNRHYGQFNAAFFGKILTAYMKRRQRALAAANVAPTQSGWTEDRAAQSRAEMREQCKRIYLRYCESGELELGLAGGVIVYDWLQRIGRVGKLEQTDEDRQRAMELFVRKLATKRTTQGAMSKVLDYDSQKIAEERMIVEAFDKMCAEGVNIEELL